MEISHDDLTRAGANLANFLKGLTARVDQLDARPNLEAATAQWNSGRKYARQRGYDEAELMRLENDVMVRRGIGRHEDAIQLDPTPPANRGWALGGIEKDALDLLLSGDPGSIDRGTAILVNRALDEER